MSVIIRPARLVDVPAMSAIEQFVSLSPWSEAQFQRVCGSDRDLQSGALVADRAGQIIGFAVYQWVLDEGSLHNIAVAPAMQRHNVGQMLMSALFDKLRDKGAAICLLEVRVSNRAAIALYRSMGFADDGLRPAYYPTEDGCEDALLMSLPLDQTI